MEGSGEAGEVSSVMFCYVILRFVKAGKVRYVEVVLGASRFVQVR